MTTLEDVLVERVAAQDVWVLSPSPPVREEEMRFQMATAEGTADLKVSVAESRAVVVDERVHHRVRLHVESSAREAPSIGDIDARTSSDGSSGES